MTVICPTVTAYEPHEYREQIERIAGFAERIHVDLMDGEFAPTKSPALEQVWWPENIKADLHLMYQRPAESLDQLIQLKPHMVVIHSEADVDFNQFTDELHIQGIKTGLALLKDTTAESVEGIIHNFDHLLVFSGRLGYHGGEADLTLLDKVKTIRANHPDIEISWDGGINEDNAAALTAGGVDVLNVGGYVQRAVNPADAYAKLEEVTKA